MKVLFVNNFRARSGGEEFLFELLTGLVQKGMTVGLVCRPGAPLETMFQGTPVNIYPVKRKGWAALTSIFTLARIIRRNGYEIVNIQRSHDIIQSWAAALLSRKNPVLLYTLQSLRFVRSRFLLGRMHTIIAVSRYTRDLISKHYPSVVDKTAVINHGIQTHKFQRRSVARGFLRDRFGIPEQSFVIGTVGNLLKNQIEFLDSLVEIRNALPGVRYALAAIETSKDPVEQFQIDTFKRRAQQLDLIDALIWAGRVPKEDMPAFYADLDLAVSSFREEGFGIWVLESLCMGVPVISFNGGGVRDILEGCPAGLLVNGAKDMAEAVISILRDEVQRTRMADSGPLWIKERFSRERMVEDYVRFFNDASSEKAMNDAA